ncbi:MAG: outer membrane beta-barrel protein [Deltaproteobacteria bacterium]|nr:outer membrane beta-barrel protein [Deltaproteobacteria bacterium]
MTDPRTNIQNHPVVQNNIPQHRLEFEVGPSWLSTGRNGPTHSGMTYQARLGQSFSISDRFRWALQGNFSHSSYSSGSDHLSRNSFGIETGPELVLIPRGMALGLYGGFHQTFYHSAGMPWGGYTPRVTFDNDSTTTFSIRPALSLFDGLLTASFQMNFENSLSTSGINPTDPRIPVEAFQYSLLFSLNLLNIGYRIRGGYPGPLQGMGDFFSGVQFSAYAEAGYHYSFNQPTGSGGAPGANTYRTNDPYHNRLRLNLLEFALERPSTDRSPFGFRFDFNFGEDPAVFAPRSSIVEPVIGRRGDPGTQYFAVQQAYLSYRFPVLEGLTLQAGQFMTTVGYEVVEGPANPTLSRGFLNTLAEPYSHAGGLFRLRIHERKNSADEVQDSTEAILGLANGWDSVLGHESGPTVITGFNWRTSPKVNLSFNYLVGPEAGGVRGLFDGILTYNPSSTVTLAANVDIGHGNDPNTGQAGMWGGLALYQQWSPVPWYNWSFREEIFGDPSGLRTGIHQNLLSLTTAMTFYSPIGIGGGPELRYDHSFSREGSVPGPFLNGSNAADSNTTFGLRLFWRWPEPNFPRR